MGTDWRNQWLLCVLGLVWEAWGTFHPGVAQGQETHVVLVEKSQVADDTNPDEQRGGTQEDAADIIACEVLWEE